MRKLSMAGVSAIALIVATPALAQQTTGTTPNDLPATTAAGSGPDSGQAAPVANATDAGGVGDIVVTAQRQSETLQTVPIAVSAFTAQALKAQQINTTADLQLTLPNITFTKGNFTSSSSFNIRGIGDLCVGVSCDAATGIAVNEVPVLGSPIAQNEYFDLERVEVLRGPQGTLFGRNATGGVVNFITAKPDLSGIHAAGDIEYGNFNSYRVRGMLNLPIGDTIGVRLAGYYLSRDGFTYNTFTNSRIDGRKQYDIRGSIRWQPSPDTTLDIVGHYFRENDNRSRIQKQLCNRDPTGILGCLPDRLTTGQLNGNATLASILTSTQFFRLNSAGGALAPFALNNLYGPDIYANFTNPADLRTVTIDSLPRFFTDEKQILGSLNHDFGTINLKIDGGYTAIATDSSVDYNLAVEPSYATNAGLNTLNFVGQLPGSPFARVRQALIPNGPAGALCQSTAEFSGTGVYGGNSICAPTSLDFDRSTAYTKQWAAEGIISSKFDGMFNFLLGASYLKAITRSNEYFVNSFGLDYASGILGAAASNGAGYLATPFYQNDSAYFRLRSYGVFGEAYAKFSDRAKLTVGLRYNNDNKYYVARTTLLNFLTPFGSTNAFTSPFFANFDADPTQPGNQPYQITQVGFKRLTGRAVLDFQFTPRNLLYFSYSRGYKSGGINPPLSPIFAVPVSFGPETVNAFEIGSKNTLAGGVLRLNLTAFYYQYKALQLSRIVARTSVNDNVDANIYGVEAEAIVRPARSVLVNLTASYLRTKISTDKFLGNPQDPSGGRADAVIIKDITNASNCAVTSSLGAAGANAFVNTVNAAANAGAFAAAGVNPPGLQPTVPIPGTNTTGAYSVCGVLQASAANAAFAPFGATVFPSGVPVNIRGNELPQSPRYKFSAGVQYTAEFGNGYNLVPRVDLAYTGGYFGSIFNRQVNRIQGYEVVNAQIQLNAPDERFFVRGFVQNALNNNAITGLYVTDQSSGLFTNAFTLEPRRYGIAAGFRF